MKRGLGTTKIIFEVKIIIEADLSRDYKNKKIFFVLFYLIKNIIDLHIQISQNITLESNKKHLLNIN